MGAQALECNLGGKQNAAFGFQALAANTAGGCNTAVGTYALCLNTTGANNVAMGASALAASTNGGANVAIGLNAMGSSTSPGQNVAVGNNALCSSTSPISNTAVGFNSMCASTAGNYNTAIGFQSLRVVSGFCNTAIGNGSGSNVTTGGNNVVIGFNSNASSSAANGETTIKSGATVARFTDAGAGASWAFSSDARMKEDVQDLPLGLDFIKEVQPRVYKWKSSGKVGSGFVAQELDEVVTKHGAEEFAGIVNKDDPEMFLVASPQLIPAMINAIKELAAENADLKARVEALENA
jgi:hypothetical protein